MIVEIRRTEGRYDEQKVCGRSPETMPTVGQVREPGGPNPAKREPPDAPLPQEDPPNEEPARKDPDVEKKPIKVEVPS
jgi:hypothetical protein